MVNTTFAANKIQLDNGGLGGGAVYVEDENPGQELDVYFINCTFHENIDASGQGTSIRPNVFNTTVQLQNTIVADGLGKNLEMDETGTVLSLGGNLSDDGTGTIYSAGPEPVEVTIFNQSSDKINTDPLLVPLTNNLGPNLDVCAGDKQPCH